MPDEVLVKAEGVSKKFCRSLKSSLWYGVQDVSNEVLNRKRHNSDLRKNEFWAVNDVSFELRRGECLGLIGPNGAGKSTLLKMLNGLVKPDQGKIIVRGNVRALIELGAGFNPILTGRENIYINGTVLGFTSNEISQKFDAIVDFSEIESFIDTPVQNYSSGMRVRLGFAVAAQMEPDILLIDEVLAVGDASFRTKCFSKMADLSKSSALVFVSHSMPLIGRMCNKALLVVDGKRVNESHDVPTNILAYQGLNKNEGKFCVGKENVQIRDIAVVCGDRVLKGPKVELDQFSRVKFVLKLELLKSLNTFEVNLVFLDSEQIGVAESSSGDHGFFVTASPGHVSIEMELKNLELNTGKYTLSIGIIEKKASSAKGEIYLSQRGFFEIVVNGNSVGYSPVQLASDWRLK